jgi:cobalt transporter subunit CbtB
MSSTALKQASGLTRSSPLMVTFGSILMGLTLVYFAGFSHLNVIHNAAHDTRHSSGFPCH